MDFRGNDKLMPKIATIETIHKLNKVLEKSFECIMQQQTKMDNKAFIFMGFLTFSITTIHKHCSDFIYPDVVILLTAIPLIISLFPIATKFSVKILSHFPKSNVKNNTHNIFYYIDICDLSGEEFKKVLVEEYHISATTPADNKLIEQILINSKILKQKVILQNIALLLLIISSLFPFINRLIKYIITLPLYCNNCIL